MPGLRLFILLVQGIRILQEANAANIPLQLCENCPEQPKQIPLQTQIQRRQQRLLQPEPVFEPESEPEPELGHYLQTLSLGPEASLWLNEKGQTSPKFDYDLRRDAIIVQVRSYNLGLQSEKNFLEANGIYVFDGYKNNAPMYSKGYGKDKVYIWRGRSKQAWVIGRANDHWLAYRTTLERVPTSGVWSVEWSEYCCMRMRHKIINTNYTIWEVNVTKTELLYMYHEDKFGHAEVSTYFYYPPAKGFVSNKSVTLPRRQGKTLKYLDEWTSDMIHVDSKLSFDDSINRWVVIIFRANAPGIISRINGDSKSDSKSYIPTVWRLQSNENTLHLTQDLEFLIMKLFEGKKVFRPLPQSHFDLTSEDKKYWPDNITAGDSSNGAPCGGENTKNIFKCSLCNTNGIDFLTLDSIKNGVCFKGQCHDIVSLLRYFELENLQNNALKEPHTRSEVSEGEYEYLITLLGRDIDVCAAALLDDQAATTLQALIRQNAVRQQYKIDTGKNNQAATTLQALIRRKAVRQQHQIEMGKNDQAAKTLQMLIRRKQVRHQYEIEMGKNDQLVTILLRKYMSRVSIYRLSVAVAFMWLLRRWLRASR